jgi:hypothetical protein
VRPQGDASGGFNSLGCGLVTFALSVVLLSVSAVFLKKKEVPMREKKVTSVRAGKTKLFLRAHAETLWAIGTSAAAGALAA